MNNTERYKKMKRCVIVGGATIENYDDIRKYLREGDFNIFCDSGLRHEAGLGITPDLIVGDFDSHERPKSQTETIVLPCEKDDTDTVFAVKEALRRSFEDFLLIGAVGNRLDHTIANVSLLLMLDSKGKRAMIADDYSEMEIISEKPAYVEDRFSYFSLLSISGTAKGVNIENAKYPLKNAEISCDYQYGVSNEVIKGKKAKISVAEGRALLIRVR